MYNASQGSEAYIFIENCFFTNKDYLNLLLVKEII